MATFQAAVFQASNKVVVAGKDITATKIDTWDAKYDLPVTGLTEPELHADVQAKLALASSAYQKPSNGIAMSDLSDAIQATLGGSVGDSLTMGSVSISVSASGIVTFKNNVNNKEAIIDLS